MKKKIEAKKQPVTHFRFSFKAKNKVGAEYSLEAENDDPHKALTEILTEAANAGRQGHVILTGAVTILATRKFISTFKPLEDEA